MFRRRVGLRLGAFLLVSLSACTLVLGYGDEVRVATDGAAPIPSGSTAPTGSAPPSSPPGRFCKGLVPYPRFCDDFDERPGVQGGWESRSVTIGTLDLVPSTRPGGDGGNELLATIVANDGGSGSARASLGSTFDRKSLVTVTYAIQVERAPTDEGFQIMALSFAPTSNVRFAVYLFVRPTGVTLVEQGFTDGTGDSFQERQLSGALSFGEWHRVEETVDIPNRRVTLEVDGRDTYAGPLAITFQSAVVSFNAGVYYAGLPTPALTIRVDDVTYDSR